MSTHRRSVAIDVTEAPEEDLLFLAWGRQRLTANVELTTDLLKQSISLNCALLGGTLVLFERGWAGAGYSMGVYAILICSLLISFLGIFPARCQIDLRDPVALRAFFERTLRRKLWFVRIAATLILFAFSLAFIGILRQI